MKSLKELEKKAQKDFEDYCREAPLAPLVIGLFLLCGALGVLALIAYWIQHA